ncbi:MAG: hypothetical protein V8S24_10460, partial [Gordonibacter pamelaeae]
MATWAAMRWRAASIFLAQVVVLLGEHRLDVVGSLLHARAGSAVQLLALALGVLDGLLALGGHVVHDLLALGRGILIHLLRLVDASRAQLLGLAPRRVHLVGDHGARLIARAGSVQQDPETAAPTKPPMRKVPTLLPISAS